DADRRPPLTVRARQVVSVAVVLCIARETGSRGGAEDAEKNSNLRDLRASASSRLRVTILPVLALHPSEPVIHHSLSFTIRHSPLTIQFPVSLRPSSFALRPSSPLRPVIRHSQPSLSESTMTAPDPERTCP